VRNCRTVTWTRQVGGELLQMPADPLVLLGAKDGRLTESPLQRGVARLAVADPDPLTI
jgi:hypothetical protein